MAVPAARRTDASVLRAAIVAGAAVLTTVLLAPWTVAVSSGGGTWSWNALGWPLVPGGSGVAVWIGASLSVTAAGWSLSRGRRREQR